MWAPGSPAPPCPINFKCYSYPWPPYFPSLSPLPASLITLVRPAQSRPLLWLILSCNWTGVPGDGRQHAPVPRVPSPEWKRARPWSISSAHARSNIPYSPNFQWAQWLGCTLAQVFSESQQRRDHMTSELVSESFKWKHIATTSLSCPLCPQLSPWSDFLKMSDC